MVADESIGVMSASIFIIVYIPFPYFVFCVYGYGIIAMCTVVLAAVLTYTIFRPTF